MLISFYALGNTLVQNWALIYNFIELENKHSSFWADYTHFLSSI